MSSGAEPPRLPRLLLGVGTDGPIGLDEHLRLHGELGAGRHGRGAGSGLIESVERAGLRGRGGAGFPAAVKLRAATVGRRRPIVVANGAEGEPANLKDQVLIAAAPHLILDGGELAAEAIGASELIVCLPRSATGAADAFARALRERPHDRRRAVLARLVLVPDTYVSGQDSALVHYLNGGPAIPTLTPPFPTERGVARRPTLVSNVETLAHIALIARHGSDWFRGVGTPAQPGSSLVTLAGAVVHPGVYEIEPGANMAAVVNAAGGANGEIRAFLLGGYSGTWLSAEAAWGTPLCPEYLGPLGAALGAGVIYALSHEACPVAETTRIARWLADETAGQCGPCVNGLDAIAGAVELVARGEAPAETGERLARWQRLVIGRGACAHPDGAARFIASSLHEFAAEFAEHAVNGSCEACAQPSSLPFPASRLRPKPAVPR